MTVKKAVELTVRYKITIIYSAVCSTIALIVALKG